MERELTNNTESPIQNVVFPIGVMVGVVGIGFTVTVVGVEVALHVPFETETE